MKKKIFIVIIVCAIVLIASGMLFLKASCYDCMKNVSTLCKISFQSILSGLITFTGLLITISFQTKQAEEKHLLDLCPCFIVEENDAASELMDYRYFANDTQKTVVCTEKSKLRSCVCLLQNTKEVSSLNVELLNDRGDVCLNLGSKAKVNEKLFLVLSGENPSTLFVRFKDSYGNQYTQCIDYKYKLNNKYVFISHKPEKQRAIT